LIGYSRFVAFQKSRLTVQTRYSNLARFLLHPKWVLGPVVVQGGPTSIAQVRPANLQWTDTLDIFIEEDEELFNDMLLF